MRQIDLILEFFENNQDRDIPFLELEQWAKTESIKRMDYQIQDVRRLVNVLKQEKKIIKTGKNMFRYCNQIPLEQTMETLAKDTKEIEQKPLKTTQIGTRQMYIDLREKANREKDIRIVNFSEEILSIYAKYEIDGFVEFR